MDSLEVSEKCKSPGRPLKGFTAWLVVSPLREERLKI